MKKFFALGLLIFGIAASANAQTVSVSQEFLNSANKSFQEVVLLRTAVAAQAKAMEAMEERDKAKDELITSERLLREALERESKVKDEQIAIYKKMNCNKSIFLFIFKKVRCK